MFQPLIDECKLRNYSPRTIKLYLYYNRRFLCYVKKKPQEVTQNDIRKYLLLMIAKHRSSSTVNLIHNALNFYYNMIMKRRFYNIPYQKREKKIKVAASKNEIRKMIAVTKNIKHKLIISLLYASGVRRAELVKIKVNDLDFSRNILLVRQGKGNKDRHTILSNTVINQIHHYLIKRPYRSKYLFASKDGHITTSTVEAVIKQARRKARVKTRITPHTLRHSFATHHLAQGTKTEYIQEMLGHKDIRTTRGYQAVTTSHLCKLISPQDMNY